MALVAALAATAGMLSSAPAEAVPTIASTRPLVVPTGVRVGMSAADTFSNAGTNPRFTSAVFSTMDYYDAALTGLNASGTYLFMKAKTNAELNALATRPPSPFTVIATVTMTNDEGQTATGTRSLQTTYARDTTPAQPAQSQPTFVPTSNISAPPGVTVTVSIDDLFDNPGTNPRFDGVGFQTGSYHSSSVFANAPLGDSFSVTVLTADDLNALAEPPPSPFTISTDVTMSNDEGQTASGTITFETTYARDDTAPAQPRTQPTLASTITSNIAVPPGALVALSVGNTFDDPGTNPRFTGVEFSTTDYYDAAQTRMTENGQYVFVRAKTAAQLSALDEPPASPFTVTATVSMTNDEDQTASGTITFETTYARVTTPAQPPAQSQPTFIATSNISAVPGVTSRVRIDRIFSNRGTNGRLTGAVFSTMDYYGTRSTGVAYRGTYLYVHAKTDAELNALDEPPASPFTVTATVTMTNDENQTASGTITFETAYTRPSASPLAGSSPPTVISGLSPVNAPPGVISATTAPLVFENLGTNARFTEVEFSTMDYYVAQLSRIFEGRLNVFVKTAAQLNALEEPPASPFTVTATVTMTNDEGHTATGTVSIRTTYDRDD